VSKILCFLIAYMSLLGLVSSSCSATGPVKEDSPRQQMILDNFDGDQHAGIAWYAPPSVAGSRAHLAIVSAPEQVVHGKALQLRYYFPACRATFPSRRTACAALPARCGRARL
jgi:hypothetical protein